jgi:hypothetical protein
MLVCTAEGQLEIVPAKMQSNRYYLSKECYVFGIARGKKESYLMIASIINDIFVNHKYTSIQEFAGEVLGEPIC